MPMAGMPITFQVVLSLLIAIVVTIYVVVAKNPHETGSPEYESLRICRVGLDILAWSYGFGLIGFVFALVAFILGIIGIVKGRSLYGVLLIMGSVIIPILSMVY